MTSEGEFKDKDEELHHQQQQHAGGFRDHDDDELPTKQAPVPKPNEAVNLFGDEPTTYVSPARRRGAASKTKPPPAPPREQQQRRPPSPPIRQRPVITASPATLSASSAHKAKGTEFFKLGRYADAVAAYTSALAPLPANHLLCLPLHNNRALARLRTGDHAGAAEDCSAALEIVGGGYKPERDGVKVAVAVGGKAEVVDLKEGWVKALRRRAEACEGRREVGGGAEGLGGARGVRVGGGARAERGARGAWGGARRAWSSSSLPLVPVLVFLLRRPRRLHLSPRLRSLPKTHTKSKKTGPPLASRRRLHRLRRARRAGRLARRGGRTPSRGTRSRTASMRA